MKKAVLLINIGSPNNFTLSGTRKYLQKFLMDKRVIDIPFVFRWLLVNMIIAPFRAPKSLQAYQKILIHQQSPLLYYSQFLKKKLQDKLGNNYLVQIAMMYGKPYLKDILNELETQPLEELIIIPLYPQYASSTTGSALEQVFKHLQHWQNIPPLRTIHSFYQHPEFIDLWAKHIHQHLPKEYDFILFSYHGLPKRQMFKADAAYKDTQCQLNNCCESSQNTRPFCYRKHCVQTTKQLVNALKLDPAKTGLCFQSRLGSSEWLKPYTSEYLRTLALQGIKKLVVVSPAFVCDCLETLYEIQIEYAHLFKQYGGKELTLIPSLNDKDEWIQFLYHQITG